MSNEIIATRTNKTVFKQDGKTVKIFAPEHKKSFVLNEVYIQSVIEEHGMNVPKILEIKQIDGCWATVSEYIEGTTLDKLFDLHPEKSDEYLNLFVDLQIKYQTEKSTALRRLKDTLRHQIQKCDLHATTRYDLYIKIGAAEKDHTICHGDYNPSNVIIAEDGTPYILDWSHATQGNGLADIALTYILFVMNNHPNTAEKYLDIYCKKTNIFRDDIMFWVPIMAAAHSVEIEKEKAEKLLSLFGGDA